MTEYKINQPIVLSFLGQFDSTDSIINPEDGTLQFDGKSIFFVNTEGKKIESHTMNNAIQIWLEQGKIQ